MIEIYFDTKDTILKWKENIEQLFQDQINELLPMKSDMETGPEISNEGVLYVLKTWTREKLLGLTIYLYKY